MAIHMHLQNLSMLAVNLDVRRFFMHYEIPTGGVQILGGPAGDAFITFRKDSDLLSALSLSGQNLLGQPVTLRIISRKDMEQVFEQRNSEFTSTQPVKSTPTSHSEINPYTQEEDDVPYANPYMDSGHHAYEGDWKETKGNEDVHKIAEAMDQGDYYMKNAQQDPRYRTGRDRGQVEIERSKDRWENGQYGMGGGPKDRDDRRGIRKQEGRADSFPGFIRLDHLPASIGHPELVDFFDYYKMSIVMPDGIVYGQDKGVNSAFIMLSRHSDALRAVALHHLEMQGCKVDVRMISEGQFYSAYRNEVSQRQFGHENYNMVPECQYGNPSFGMVPEAPYHGENQAFMQTGYIRIHNLPGSLWYKGLRAFLRSYNLGFDAIGKNAITMKNDSRRRISTALIECTDYQVALKIKALDKTMVEGKVLKVEMISNDAYGMQKKRWDMEQESLNQGGLQKGGQLAQKGFDARRSYIRMRNLPWAVNKKELRAFLQEYGLGPIGKNDIFMGKDNSSQTSTGLVQVTDDQVARKAASLRNCRLEGQLIRVEKISFNKYTEDKARLIRQAEGNTQKKELPKEKADGLNHAPPCYVMIHNLSPSVKFRELKAFFREYGMSSARNGIKLKVGEQYNTAYMKFNSLQDVLKIDSFDYSKLDGDGVNMEVITEDVFEHLDLDNVEGNDTPGAKNTNQEKTKEDQPHFSDPTSAIAPDDRRYFIKFDQLADDTTACEIWNWFGGSHGVSNGVYLVRRVDNDNAIFGYVAFANAHHRNSAMAENEPCKAVSANKAYHHLAEFGPSYRIFQATKMGKDQEMSEDQRAALMQKIRTDPTGPTQNKSSIFYDVDERMSAEPGNQKFLCFIRLSKLAADATAWTIWKQYGAARGNSKGVVVVRRRDATKKWQTLFAYVAFGSHAHRTVALKAAAEKRKCNIKAVYASLFAVEPDCSIYECTTPGNEHKVSTEEKALLEPHFSVEKRKESNAGKLRKANNLEEIKEESSTKQADQPSVFSRLIVGAESPDSKQLNFIRFLADAIPEDATASGMCRWLGGPNKTSIGGILIRTAKGVAESAFIMFEDKLHCRVALTESEGGLTRTAASTRRAIVAYDSEFEVFESTDTGEDRKVSEEQLQKLKQVTPLEVDHTHGHGTKRKAQDIEKLEAKKTKIQTEVQASEPGQTLYTPTVEKNGGSAKSAGVKRKRKRNRGRRSAMKNSQY